MTELLKIEDLHVRIEDQEILKGVNLTVKEGEIAALMGPNGSGKSTLAYTLMGHPKYEVTKGKIIYKGEDITTLKADERSKRGIFLSFQYPHEVSGLTVTNFLRTAMNMHRERSITIPDFQKILEEKMQALNMDPAFAERYLNEGFSGGEKKRMEILQMALLYPELAILDETDSGLDIDALKIVAEGVNSFRRPDFSALIITHYTRILNYIQPDAVHILYEGKIAESGGKELADHLEEKGYARVKGEKEVKPA